MLEKTMEAVLAIREKTDAVPRLGIILGSGLGQLAAEVEDKTTVAYSDIPHFPIPTVMGHVGNLVIGTLGGVGVAVFQGRFHHYEGYYMREVTFPVRVLAGLGAKSMIVTNASGGVSDRFSPGDFLAVTDHINLMGANPLVGVEPDEKRKDAFVDLTGAYDPGLVEAALGFAEEAGIELKKGVLAAMSGPSYETPAEVRMLKLLGADAVCMSTVPEVIMARYLGLSVLGLSLVTNKAAGAGGAGPEHSEVLRAAEAGHKDFVALVVGTVKKAAAGGLL